MRALQANELGRHLPSIVAELDFWELPRAELYLAVLTHVGLEVKRMDPPFSAILAYQFYLYCGTSFVLAFMSRPVGGVIRFQAFGAPEPRLAGFAYQTLIQAVNLWTFLIAHRLLIEQAASKLAFALVTLVGSVCAHIESSLVAI